MGLGFFGRFWFVGWFRLLFLVDFFVGFYLFVLVWVVCLFGECFFGFCGDFLSTELRFDASHQLLEVLMAFGSFGWGQQGCPGGGLEAGRDSRTPEGTWAVTGAGQQLLSEHSPRTPLSTARAG